MKTIGARVAYARTAKQWSQSELARRIGVQPQAIQQIESNRTKRSRYLPDIAKVTGFELDWLLTGIGSPRSRKDASTEPVSRQELSHFIQHFADTVAAAVAAGRLDADTLELLERLLEKLTLENPPGKR